MQNNNCCYVGTVREFLDLKENCSGWIEVMKEQFQIVYPHFELQKLEIASWKDTFHVLQKVLTDIEAKDKTYIVFEYKLPEEGGRRPDVLLINDTQICILEFKKKPDFNDANLDQVIEYARDLTEYHEKSRKMNITPYLILTETEDLEISKRGSVLVRSPDKLTFTLNGEKAIDIQDWLDAKYEPLPTMMESALKLRNEAQRKYPEIFQVRNTNIPIAEQLLNKWVTYAKDNKKIVFACLTGAPGTGKTLLGLNLIYNHIHDKPIYLTANKALCEVLQEELGNDAYVNSIFKCKEAGNWNHSIVVIDEGQRIWDANNDIRDFGIHKDDIIHLMNQNEWGFILVIFAQGQIFNYREHENLTGWLNAIDTVDEENKKWEILSPSVLSKELKGHEFEIIDEFELVESLRAQRGKKLNQFVNTLLHGDFKEAQSLYQKIDDSFPIYITQDLETAKKYCHQRYDSSKRKSYGVITSSKSTSSSYLQVKCDFSNWYLPKENGIDSSENFKTYVTELGCQGLELDMPIIYWGDDLTWLFSPVTKQNYYDYMEYEDERKQIDWNFDDIMHKYDEGFQYDIDQIDPSSDNYSEKDNKCWNKILNYIADDNNQWFYKKIMDKDHIHNKESDYLLKRYQSVLSQRLINGIDIRTKYRLPPNEISVINSSDFLEWRGFYFGCNLPLFAVGNDDFQNYNSKRHHRINYYEKTQYIANTYRVLLTRGRDGMILYIPNGKKYGDTYALLKRIGLKELDV